MCLLKAKHRLGFFSIYSFWFLELDKMSSHMIRTFPSNDGSVKAQFTWVIDNFLDRPEKHQELIQSPQFFVEKPGGKTIEWYLCLYPKSYYYSEDNVAVHFYNAKKIPVKFSHEVSILDSSQRKRYVNKIVQADRTKEPISIDTKTGVYKWLSRHNLKQDAATLLPGGQMTVYYELTIHNEASKVSSRREEDIDLCSKAKRFKEVGESFGKLLDDKDLTDMTIKCGAQDFPCHSLVLSARSPVFKAMFQANMKERESREVIIEDIEPAVFAEMLHFIYTGETKDNALEKTSVELLAAADKYELNSLKQACEDNLCSGLTKSNAVQYLILGDFYKSLKLREKALKKVATNMTSIVKTEAYQELKQYPDILIDIPKAMIENSNSIRTY